MYKFNNLYTAKSFTDHALKIWFIMLGDDELFWVVTPAQAAKLERQGYEYAE